MQLYKHSFKASALLFYKKVNQLFLNILMLSKSLFEYAQSFVNSQEFVPLTLNSTLFKCKAISIFIYYQANVNKEHVTILKG